MAEAASVNVHVINGKEYFKILLRKYGILKIIVTTWSMIVITSDGQCFFRPNLIDVKMSVTFCCFT